MSVRANYSAAPLSRSPWPVSCVSGDVHLQVGFIFGRRGKEQEDEPKCPIMKAYVRAEEKEDALRHQCE